MYVGVIVRVKDGGQEDGGGGWEGVRQRGWRGGGRGKDWEGESKEEGDGEDGKRMGEMRGVNVPC